MPFPAPFSRVLPGDLVHNTPVISLIFANLVTIVLAILGNWDLATVMFIYWAQSVTIGFFTVVSLLTADTATLAVEMEKPIRERGGTETVTPRFVRYYECLLAGFFALHYGLFHWGYYSFIVESGLFGTVNFSDPPSGSPVPFSLRTTCTRTSRTGTRGQRDPATSTSSFSPPTVESSRCTSPLSPGVS